MADYITLMGVDDVRSAGNRMSSAADTMRTAAGQIDESLRRHEQFLDDWLQRFETAIQSQTAAAP